MSDYLYINVYSVTRHYGGPEEGGWWYNSGTPLASVPIQVERLDECPNHDEYGCRCTMDQGIFVSSPDPDDPNDLPIDFHFRVPELEKKIQMDHLQALLAGEEWGNIYSMGGGMECQIRIEDHFAAYWPATRPTYE
jgi:hypothetical protein